MGRYILSMILLLCIAEQVYAQTPVILGDTDVVGILDYDASCFFLTIDSLSNPKFEGDSRSLGEVRISFAPSQIGYDSVAVSMTAQAKIKNNCGRGGAFTREYSALGVSDSLVLMRPRNWGITLFADTMHGGWTGTTTPLLFNNVTDSTTFDNWLLRADSSLGATVEVSRDAMRISSTTLAPLETRVPIVYTIRCPRGPIYSDYSDSATIDTHVRNHTLDTLNRVRVMLTLRQAPYTLGSGFSPHQLSFTTMSGSVDSADVIFKIDSRANSVRLSSLIAPFSFRVVDSATNARTIRVYCRPSFGGQFAYALMIYTSLTDFNGDPRLDSNALAINCRTVALLDTTFWEPTAITSATLRVISAGESQAVYVSTQDTALVTQDAGNTFQAVEPPLWNGLAPKGPVYADDRGGLYLVSQSGSSYCHFPADSSWKVFVGPFDQNYQHITNYVADISISRKGLVSMSYWESWVGTHGVTGEDSGTSYWDEYYSGTVKILGATNELFPSFRLFDSTRDIFLSNGLLYASNLKSDIQAMAVDNAGNYYAGTYDNGLFTSTDLGVSWTPTNLTLQHISCMATTPDGWIYVSGLGSGVVRSSDRGSTWQGVSGGLPVDSVNILAAQPGGRLYAGVPGHGLYRSISHVAASSPLLVSSLSLKLPAHFTISQNYPNPFSSTTSFSYALPEAAHIRIALFDEVGREVARIVDESKPAGVYRAMFDAKQLQTGTYFLRATEGSKMQTLKISILK